MSKANAGSRWVEIAETLARKMPGEWVLAGRGQRAVLVRRPIGWTVPFIAFGQTSYGEGRLFAARMSLLEPYTGWKVTFGISLQDTPLYRPKLVITEPAAADRVERFVMDHALAAVDAFPEPRMVEVCAGLQPPIDLTSSPYWAMAPGWAVITGQGSPVPSATAFVEFWTSRDPDNPDMVFYRDLIAQWEAGGGDAALAHLQRNREEIMTSQKLPDADRSPAPWT